MVIHAPKEGEVSTVDELFVKIRNSGKIIIKILNLLFTMIYLLGFLFYVVVVCVTAVLLR